MKEMEKIEELLKVNNFLFNENEETWIRDQWNVRIIDDEMEIYENINKGNRYLKTQLIYEDLTDILGSI